MTDRDNTGTEPTAQALDAFIERWQGARGKERANYQLFLTELCQLLDLPGPEPGGDNDEDDAYVFERRVDIQHPDGTTSRGYIDLYKRGHFVLEAKRISEKAETSRWDKAMLRAAARPTPTSAPCPPTKAGHRFF
jgi:hypothetical protein